MKILILITVAAWLSGVVSKILSSRSDQNNYGDAEPETNILDSDWVTIKPARNEIRAFAGESIGLECEASGSPQPLIQFYKSASDLISEQITSNEISQYSNTGLVKVKGRIHLIVRKTQVIFCKATSGSKTAQAAITIFVSDTHFNKMENEVWEYESKDVSIKANAPKITFFDTLYMDDIGSTVILPCTASAGAKARIIWLDQNEDNIEEDNDRRLTITPFGELKIRNVQWNDMGVYTCIATNQFGKDSITTFLYPMLAEK